MRASELWRCGGCLAVELTPRVHNDHQVEVETTAKTLSAAALLLACDLLRLRCLRLRLHSRYLLDNPALLVSLFNFTVPSNDFPGAC